MVHTHLSPVAGLPPATLACLCVARRQAAKAGMLLAALALVFSAGARADDEAVSPFLRAKPGAPLATPLWVTETTGEGRESAFICVGVPVARGLMRPAGRVRLQQAGLSVPTYTSVVSKWTDGSVRVFLLRFRLRLPARERVALTLEVNAPAAGPQIGVTNLLTDPGIVPALPPEWYCHSGAFGPMVSYRENRIDRLLEIRISGKGRKYAKLPLDKRNGYYDHTHAQYMWFLRSGSVEGYLDARRWAAWYRKEHGEWLEQYRPGDAIPWKRLRYMYVQGLVEDYEISGDTKSFETARRLADAYLESLDANSPAFRVNERNPSFPIMGLTWFYELTGEKRYIEGAKAIVHEVCRWRDRKRGGWIRVYEDKAECPHGCKGGSPFMTALLGEALGHYHRVTQDPVAAEAIVGACDWLIRETWWPSLGRPELRTFVYIQCRGADGKQPGKGRITDLNTSFALILGYAWHLTGNPKYREVAIQAIQAVRKAFGAHAKAYNQGMRNLGHGLYYLQAPPRPKTAT